MMKKMILAACLILAAGTAFSQIQQSANDGNGNGQNDCQCIGIGIPVSTQGIQGKPSPVLTKPGTPPDKESIKIYGLWRTYIQVYIWELRNSLPPKRGK